MSDQEHPLSGGRSTAGVVRVGDTVRRPRRANSAQVENLLGFLEAEKFEGTPRCCGTDERGRQVLSFLPGGVPADLAAFSDSQLAAAARLLRRFHDAAAPLAARWRPGAETVCHNDWGPTNTVFRAGLPWGLIDFDMIAPGARLWDLGCSAALWLDLGDPDYSGAEQVRRLSVFADAYGRADCTAPRIAAFAVAQQTLLGERGRAEGKPDLAEWAAASAAWTARHVLAALHGTSVAPAAQP